MPKAREWFDEHQFPDLLETLRQTESEKAGADKLLKFLGNLDPQQLKNLYFQGVESHRSKEPYHSGRLFSAIGQSLRDREKHEDALTAFEEADKRFIQVKDAGSVREHRVFVLKRLRDLHNSTGNTRRARRTEKLLVKLGGSSIKRQAHVPR